MIAVCSRFSKSKLEQFDEVAQSIGISRTDLLRLCMSEKVEEYNKKNSKTEVKA